MLFQQQSLVIVLTTCHSNDFHRRIIHVDMDAYYAAVEQRDRPELRGQPVAVGSDSPRGVVLTASYEARKFGVRSAMPSQTAKRLCPDLLFVRPRFDAYKSSSRILRQIFACYTDMIEPLSLDEAYLDVTRSTQSGVVATDIAKSIKKDVVDQLELTASAGVSYNKFLAKLASDMQKPDGLTIIRPKQARTLLANLPIEKFHGIGPATAKRLHAQGIRTGADIQAHSAEELTALVGKSGNHFWHMAQGNDNRPVDASRQRHSLSVETTFASDITNLEEVSSELQKLCLDLISRCNKISFYGRTLTLKDQICRFSCPKPQPHRISFASRN